MKQVLNILCFVLLYVLNNINGKSFRETTSSKPDIDDGFEYLKPTSMARRINVEIRTRKVPVQLFRVSTKKPYKKSLVIWKWDRRCHKQPVIGNCKQRLRRYFYEVSRKECVNFTYSGCNGNSNNFKSHGECEKHCKGVLTPVANKTDTSFCGMQPNAGMCFDIFHRYYYDINQRKCLHFIYGGCGGNDNNFETERDCMKICGHTTNKPSVETFEDEDSDSLSV